MGLFDRIKTTASGVGASIAKGAGQITGKATVEAKESAKIAAVKADIAAVQAEIDTGYVQIGKAYVDACIAGKEVTDIGCGATLKMMEPKLEKKMKLEKELIELEKAKAMGAITDADYNARLAQANKKLEHFDDIRMLKKQKDLGLLTAAEFDAKVNELLK